MSRWHRLGFSVKGDSVTLVLDCKKHINYALNRGAARVSTSGIILIGQQLLDEGFFTVRIRGRHCGHSANLLILI